MVYWSAAAPKVGLVLLLGRSPPRPAPLMSTPRRTCFKLTRKSVPLRCELHTHNTSIFMYSLMTSTSPADSMMVSELSP